MRIADPVRNGLAGAFAAAVDAGAGDSVVQLRTGAPPANITDAAAGLLIATVNLPATTFGAPATGAVTANAITTVQAAADGTIGHFRVLDGDAAVIEDSGSVGTSGTELVVNSLTVTEGADVTIDSWTVTMPAG